MRAKLDLTIEEGTYRAIMLKYLGPSRSVVSLDSLTPRLQVRNRPGGTLLNADRGGSPVPLSFGEDNNFLHNKLTTGKLYLVLPGDFEYDFEQAYWEVNLIPIALTAIALGGATININANSTQGRTVFTASAGTPFSGLAVGDIVRTTGAEDSANNSSWEVYSVDGGGSGFTSTRHNDYETNVDNATDSSIAFTYIDKSDTDSKYMERYAMSLAGGLFRVSKKVIT